METAICPKCGIEKSIEEFSKNKCTKSGRATYCKNCNNAWHKAYAQTEKGKKKLQERGHAWYEAHKEYHHQKTNAWRRAHPESGRETSCKWRMNNIEKRRRYEEKRYAANPEFFRAKAKKYAQEHPEKYAQYYRARRDLLKSTMVEKIDYAAIANRDGMICHICGEKIERKDLSFDHLIPLSKGGPNISTNIRVAHKRCNAKRGAGKIPAQLLLIG